MSFIAGSYLMAYNSKVCGQTAEGITFERQVFKRMITGDWFGDAPQEGILRGTELTSQVTFLEADAEAMRDILFPYQGGVAATSIVSGLTGVMDVKHGVAKSLVLTTLMTATLVNANGGTGASSVTPLTRTLPRTILAEGYPVREMLKSDLRDVPMRFRHYPSQFVQGESSFTLGGLFGTET